MEDGCEAKRLQPDMVDMVSVPSSENSLLSVPDNKIKPSFCYKCKKSVQDSISYDVGSSVSCASCFERYVEESFRRILRTKCYVDRGRHIAVALSGGDMSLRLFHLLISGCLKPKDSKKGTVRPRSLAGARAVYVDVARLFLSESSQEKEKSMPGVTFPNVRQFRFSSAFCPWNASNDLRSHIKMHQGEEFEFVCLDPVVFAYPSFADSDEDRDHVVSLFQQCASEIVGEAVVQRSALEDLLAIVINRSLAFWSLSAAEPITILLGESATRVTELSFHYLSQAGGSQIPLISNYCDTRFLVSFGEKQKCRGTLLVRPLKKFSLTELDTYLTLSKKVNMCRDLDRTSKADRSQTRESLVETFVSSLSKANYQTVNIATQTLEKMSSRSLVAVPTESGPQRFSFRYGRCRCCFGCMESPCSKALGMVNWSRKQCHRLLHIVAPYVSHTSPEASDDREKSEEEEFETPEHLKNCSSADTLPALIEIAQYLCMRCASIAVSSHTTAEMVALLVSSSDRLSALLKNG